MTPICFIDTETTGLGPASEPWEIAVIRRDDTGETEHHFFVSEASLDLVNADRYALQLGGFYDRHPDGQRLSSSGLGILSTVESGSNVAEEVARLTFGAYLVGVNVAYDVDVLTRFLRAYGLLPAWDYHLADLYALAAGWLNGRGEDAVTPPWPKSDVLAERCGVEPPSGPDRHTALGDARWARRWFDAITPTTLAVAR